jgi:PAS domain S-box-containing protein
MSLALALLVLSTWLVFSASSFASEPGKTKRVLILYSFKYGLSANVHMDGNKVTGDAIQATMEEEIADGIGFQSERMDVSTLPENRYFEELRDTYRKKYDGQPIDLIIAVNFRALKFLINHGEEIWPNTPILFCGLEKGRREQLKRLRPNITGLFVDARFGDMIDTIFKIHPNTQQVTVIVGTSETERFIEARVRQAYREYVGRVDFTSLSNFGFDAILSRVADLPPNSIVLFLTLLQDGEGKSVPENALHLISRMSNVPVYGLFDVYVGHGIVGGSLYSVENRGIMIGKMGVRILAGEKPRDIPIETRQKHFNLYDWRQLKRWGIAESDLPQGSIVRYREQSFYELYYKYIWGVVALIVLETLLINLLLISRARRLRAEQELQKTHHKLEETNVGLKNEIVERKQTEEELHESEERYRSLVDKLPAAIIAIQDGNFLFSNPFGLRLLGFSDLKDILGRRVLDIVSPEFRELVIQRMESLAQGKNNPTFEMELLKTDGTIVAVESTSVSIQIDGKQTGLIICNDVTQRKQAEKALLKSQEEVKHLDRVTTMGELTTAIAHEINQPLAAILSNAQAAIRFLNDERPDFNQVEDALHDIVSDDKRAAEVIRRLQRMIKKKELEHERLELDDIIQETVNLIQSEIITTSSSIAMDLETGIPIVYGDRIQIQQVILNLLLNALDAVKSQPLEARKVRISARVGAADSILISVSDSGLGIEDHKLETVFDAFYTTKNKGIGMGLPVSKSIIEQHNGRIWASNNPEGGAVFAFTLPISKNDIYEDRLLKKGVVKDDDS